MRFYHCAVLFIVPAVLCFAQTPVLHGPAGKMVPSPIPFQIHPSNMVLIPGGKFEMGDHHGVGDPDELPVHTAYIDAFYMNIHEVTNKEYCRFLNSAYSLGSIQVFGGAVFKAGLIDVYCDTTGSSQYSRITGDGSTFGIVAGKENHPMTRVSWYGAAAYANWRSEQAGLSPCYDLNTWGCNFGAGGFRMPTEAEWEKAARGGEHDPYYMYPWGNAINGSKANYWSSGDPFESGDSPYTTPVGYYEANGYGLHDMAGNLFEWVNDRYSSTYYGSSPYNNPKGATNGVYRIWRGGSWAYGFHQLRCADRYSYGYPDGRLKYLGFRLVLEVP